MTPVIRPVNDSAQMLSIFFDLETTDKNTIGQIINFCFIAVDASWRTRASLSGDIRVSRLQLPRAGALLANRTNILEHQARAEYSEPQALRRIVEFIQELLNESSEPVALIGYNSTRFDVPYLRTSLIRNGLNPYFSGKLQYRDLLHVVRWVACRDNRLPQVAHPEKPGIRSLSLEHVTQSLGLLSGEQAHDSRADVELTISLARCLAERFAADVRSFSAYQMKPPLARGDIRWEMVPEYELASGMPCAVRPIMLLDDNHRYALWVQLDRYRAGEGRRAISWCNKAAGSLFAAEAQPITPELAAAAEDARREFKGVNLKNFFEPSSCDIEQDIYRLDSEAIDALHQAIWRGDPPALQRISGRDARVVYLRHQLCTHQWGSAHDGRMREMLKKYAQHRYGGALKLCKGEPAPDAEEPFHPTLAALFAEIDQQMESAAGPQKKLLEALKTFYLDSDLYQIAGEALLRGPVLEKCSGV